MTFLELRRYAADDGREPFTEWLSKLRDASARARIETRLGRLSLGNFGDCKALREGVMELRIDWGPGYRVYFSRHGSMVVLLLVGGDKRTQTADIDKAIGYWRDFRRRQA